MGCPDRFPELQRVEFVYFNEVDRGGHFAAWEQPQLFTEELRAAFRAVRETGDSSRKGVTMSSQNTRLVELTANGDADQVETRLREALDAHGLQLFARIDHATSAR